MAQKRFEDLTFADDFMFGRVLCKNPGICLSDPFTRSRCKYTYRNTCIEDNSLTLDDGATKIFLNAAGNTAGEEISDELRAFLRYVAGQPADTVLTKNINRAVQHVIEENDGREEYMTLLERDRRNLQEGIKKGTRQGERNAILAAFKAGALDENYAAATLQVTIPELKKMAAEYKPEKEETVA